MPAHWRNGDVQVKKKILVAAGFGLCLLGGCSSAPTSYETGKTNLEEQNYTQAIEDFQDAVDEGGILERNRHCLDGTGCL